MAEAEKQRGGTVPKSDFCALFAKTNLLERLALLGNKLQTEEGKRECPKALVSANGLLAEISHVRLCVVGFLSLFSTSHHRLFWFEPIGRYLEIYSDKTSRRARKFPRKVPKSPYFITTMKEVRGT
jgi:hypothetical protein